MKIDNKTQPAIRTPEAIAVPLAEMQTLSNGVRLYTLDCSDHDVVRFSFVFHAGTAMQSVPFSASSTANLLSEGTQRHSAQQIAEILDYHGSFFEVTIDRDYAVINFASLLKYFPQTLAMASEIVLHPTFAQDEVTLYCEKRKQRLAVERSKATMKARELFGTALFGAEHPYGVSYDESLYDDLTREDVVEFYKRHYTAGNCFVVCSGRVGEREREMIAEVAARIPVGVSAGHASASLSDQSTRGGEVAASVEFPTPHSTPFAFRAHEGAVQSSVRMGVLLFPRTHPDFIAMQVLCTVLGGYFGSRLVRNLREKHGYTYGAFASMATLEHAGYMAIATEVATEATQDAIAQIFSEIERLRTEPVGGEELQMVKNIMTGEVMRILDGPFGIADVTIENVSNGTTNDYNDRWLAEVRDITPERLLDVARRYLPPDAFTTVVVGDKSLYGD
ncbi:MAG: insulinase family protein [Rikenellaceae bacterium]|nr:insulinase family protein [Rikenellaceae bacterium]MCL2693329.1 insulinase family protein [Rikenellaceae bacterium]